MNVTYARTELAIALGDSSNTIYPTNVLNSTLLRSVRAYSQYRPCLRRIGTASLLDFSDPVGTTSMQIVGGMLYIGQNLWLDYGSPDAEFIQIASIALQDQGPEPVASVKIGLVAPTVNVHTQGALLMPLADNSIENASAKSGLFITGGQDSYLLPADFVKPENSSFDLAVGAKLTYRKQNGYYDASALFSAELSGTGFGRADTYGPAGSYAYPLVGDPFVNPNAGIFPPYETAWRFYINDNPLLRVIPSPTQQAYLDFDYYGCQTLQSVPSSDQELITLYARYAALSARANGFQEATNMGAPGDITLETFKQTPSKNVEMLLKAAQDTYTLWDKKLRSTPFAVAG